jgi:4-amino-4-deoxy-L-arabinose transferase-like glycosyltransferase
VPVAVGATAGAVGGLANSGLVVRLTRGRLWIGALAVLLVGIVALNVMALSLNASSSKTGRQADALKQQNSALRAQLAGQISSQKVQRLATSLGLVFPEPGSIRYLKPESGDAAEAARRLRSGDLALATVAPVVPATTTEVVPPPAETAAPPVEAPLADTATPAPETTAPVETDPPPAAAAGGGGGVASP